MIIFAILKLTHVINLSWWWIFAALGASFIPMGMTISFVLLKLLGIFCVEVSWAWIALPIFLDVAELSSSIADSLA